MIIFLDTEYTDPVHIDLISIGMVSEDGAAEFYAQRCDFRAEDCNAFVREDVLPLLDAPAGQVMTRAALALHLWDWFTTLPRRVVIGCDDRTDYALLVDALGGEVPANVAGIKDLRPLVDSTVFHQAACRYHDAPGQPWHHALHDAKAHRAGWLAWMASRSSAQALKGRIRPPAAPVSIEAMNAAIAEEGSKDHGKR